MAISAADLCPSGLRADSIGPELPFFGNPGIYFDHGYRIPGFNIFIENDFTSQGLNLTLTLTLSLTLSLGHWCHRYPERSRIGLGVVQADAR